MLKKLLLCFIVTSLIVGCNKIEGLLTFPINDRTNIQIESTSPLDLPLELPMPPVTSNSQQQYQNNKTNASLVRDIRLDEVKLTITGPTGKTFSFLTSIKIFISADQQPEMEIASLENISSTSSVLQLITTDEKLDNYAKSPAYELRTEITTDEALTEDVDVQVDLRFFVTADTF